MYMIVHGCESTNMSGKGSYSLCLRGNIPEDPEFNLLTSYVALGMFLL